MTSVMTRMATTLAVAALVWGAAAAALAVPVLAVDTDPGSVGIQAERTVGLGDTFDVALVIRDLDASEPLHAFEFDLLFDPSVVLALSASDAGYLGGSVFELQNDVTAPDVNYAITTIGTTGQLADGVILSLTLQAVGLGESPLDLQNVILSRPFGVAFSSFELEDGLIRVVDLTRVIPEPHSAVLFAAGGLIAGWALRRDAGRGRKAGD